MADGSQDGILYVNLAGDGIVKYFLATQTAVPTGVHIDGTAFANGGDGFFYANGGASVAAARQLWRLLPEVPAFAPQLVGTGARRIEDIATARDGTMYGVGEGHLFRLDRTTGAQTDIGSFGFDAAGLAFQPDGQLLTLDGTHVMALDRVTGSATYVTDLPWGSRDLAGVPGWLTPPPVPDGTFGTPMHAGVGNAPVPAIQLSWDVTTCAGGGYHVLYGPLSGVSTYTLGGAVCSIGTSGSYLWNGVPAGNLWFVVVADNTSSEEGTWGTNSAGADRSGSTPSFQCGMTKRGNGGMCP